VLLSKRVDGILLTKAAGEASSGTRRMIADMKGPCVLMMRTYPDLTDDAVIIDDVKASMLFRIWLGSSTAESRSWVVP
jgi:DNA-binding LacI/PurR family transcriptional regulator